MIKLLFLAVISFHQPALTSDSLGIETINGQTFVIHRVEEKETLFGISRRYGTTVDAILQHNTSAGSGLEIGQILRVPWTPRPVRLPAGQSSGRVHKVVQGETLYAISRKYNVSPDEIRRANNLSDNTISVGQELIIRSTGAAPVQSQPVQSQPVQSQPVQMVRKGVHTVESGQTLYAISRQYGVTVEEIRQWNNLQGNELRVGQTLYVAQPERSEVAQQTTAPASPVESPRPVEEKSTVAEQAPVVAMTPPAESSEPQRNVPSPVTGQSAESIRISESLKSGDEIVEAGLAELIEGTDGNRKYLALHRTAPMGTILKVRNEMNNREVFVRVMGKLPDTSMTDKVIIRISKSAYDRLGAIDPRFRVEVTYYK